ncbi:pilus assembly FimT family protein [Campylobacter hominis]|uniref:N-methylation n=1 Tax=Campylobacter hominis (strain ATCC BAA-381 / DSM 21671 / CCUG 45161 / LMG 19568 / NCTC 13146 / CH001A) TaxID=360107 RepID=A7I1K9_CAMHC|nr:type II secretion system protein [Campylobacter hominis]ABS51266.1 N- methylation [Campylobacter hominis ATCC BAA-381]UAK86303.1 type II secretion system GspH family protein [Campylobacter hominis]SUW84940.1 N- methylation [Campylobacter hominis]
MKKAFTMIELIFIIVVVGILAAVAIPRIDRDNLIELVDQVTTHIRYTQQLAMMDNVYDGSDEHWYRGYWRIQFSDSADGGDGWKYSVYKDLPGYSGNLNSEREVARDPQNEQRFLTSGASGFSANTDSKKMNKKLNLKNTYDIQKIDFDKNCGGQTIAFDSKGRPHGAPQNAKNPYDKVLHTPCIITFTDSGGRSIQIAVQPETGFISDNRAEAIEKNWKAGNFKKFDNKEF